MALSESGLAAQGIIAGPMIYGPAGSRKPIRAKSGPAPKGSIAIRPGGKQNLYRSPRHGK